MKCTKCGAELKEGCLFCSVCGHEAQMVSGYSDLEDEYLRSILTQNNTTTTDKGTEKTEVHHTEKKKEQKASDKISNLTPIIVILCILFILIAVGVGIKLYLNYKNNNSYEYQMTMAQKEMSDMNFEEALSYYKNALSIQPDDTTVRMQMADLYLKENDYDSAMVLLMEVINLDQKNKDAYTRLISIYEEREEYDKVKELSDGVEDADILELFDGYLVSEPVFYPDAGNYDTYMTVTILSIDGDPIYYTLDGTEPTKENGRRYPSNGIELDESGTYNIKAVCCNEKGIYSDVVNAKYKINARAPEYPEVAPDGGNFTELTYVSIEAQEDCTIYYTWDGTDPTEASAVYTDPIEIPEGNNILSIIVIDNRSKLSSDIYRANYIYEPQ